MSNPQFVNTGQEVWVVQEYCPRVATYTHVMKTEITAKSWIEYAVASWHNETANKDEVAEWLKNNPGYTVEDDAEFIMTEVSGISFETYPVRVRGLA